MPGLGGVCLCERSELNLFNCSITRIAKLPSKPKAASRAGERSDPLSRHASLLLLSCLLSLLIVSVQTHPVFL